MAKCDIKNVTVGAPKTKNRVARGIYKRGNVYWLAVQKDKKRHFISLGTDDYAQAILNATRIRHSPSVESGSILKYAVERFIAQSGWSRASVDSRGYVLKKFAEWCGDILPSDVRTDRVKRYHSARLECCTEATAYSSLGVVSRFFDWCRDEEKTVRENPCDALTVPYPEASPRKDFCTPELVEKLIRECDRDDLKFVLLCGFHAGLRAIEIVEAVPFWFDLERRQLHLRKTPTCRFKDREERSVPLTSQFSEFLKSYGLREPFMLHPEKLHARNRYRWDFGRPFREYMAAQGCPWVTPHIMRHTFASLLASAGESIYRIAVWLGDDVRVVQGRYAKLLPVRGKLDEAFQVPPPSKSTALKASHAASKRTRL